MLEPLFLKYGVNVVYAGHDHIYERLTPQKGIYYFVSGSAGQLRKGDLKRSAMTAAGFDADQSFMINEIVGDDLYFQAITRTGKTVDSGVIHGSRNRPTPAPVGDQRHVPAPDPPSSARPALSFPRESDPHADVRQPRRSDRGRQRADEVDLDRAGSARRRRHPRCVRSARDTVRSTIR